VADPVALEEVHARDVPLPFVLGFEDAVTAGEPEDAREDVTFVFFAVSAEEVCC